MRSNRLTRTVRVLALCAAGLLAASGAALAQTSAPAASTAAVPDAPALYQQHCAACHAPQRTGAMGPALLPESLERVRPAEVLRVIGQGRTATQMPGFAGTLSAAEIQALAQWVRSPVQPAPTWGDDDIRASRVATPAPADEPAKPVWSADPMNLFLVVEGATTMFRCSMATSLKSSPVLPAATPCTVAPSSRPTGAMCSLARAMAGSLSTTCGAFASWPRCVRA